MGNPQHAGCERGQDALCSLSPGTMTVPEGLPTVFMRSNLQNGTHRRPPVIIGASSMDRLEAMHSPKALSIPACTSSVRHFSWQTA